MYYLAGSCAMHVLAAVFLVGWCVGSFYPLLSSDSWEQTPWGPYVTILRAQWDTHVRYRSVYFELQNFGHTVTELARAYFASADIPTYGD